MMNVFPCSLLLIFGMSAFTVSGQCTICPRGVENATAALPPMPDAMGQSLTCADVDTAYQGYDEFECLASQPVAMPLCCPSQLPEYGISNVCGWCPNGVPDVYLQITDPILQTQSTCLNAMELVAFQTDSDGCDSFDWAASYCCPEDSNAPPSPCEFCPKGVEFPGLDPDGEGSNCGQINAQISQLSDAQSCNLFKSLELKCCPGTTELKKCEFCSEGITNNDTSISFPNGSTCTDIQNEAETVPEGDLCGILKDAEGTCCPSSTDSTLPPLLPPVLPPPPNDDDYCYICGSADVKMTKPDFQPFSLFNDENQNSQTCLQLEEQYNKDRIPEASCSITLSTLTALLYAPSACGCVGFEPPNACKACVDRNIIRDQIIPDFGVTCGEGFDLLQHAQSIVCTMPDLNLEGLQEACCPASGSPNTSDGGNGDTNGGDAGTGDGDGSSSKGMLMGLLLCVLPAIFSV